MPNVIFVCKSDVMSLSNCDAYTQCNIVALIEFDILPYQSIPLPSHQIFQFLDPAGDTWLLRNMLLLSLYRPAQGEIVLEELVLFLYLNHKSYNIIIV